MASLTKICKELIIREPFYGLFFLGIQKRMVPADHQIKTAAIGPNGLNFTLYVNEKFWDELSDEHQFSVIKHEALHLVLFHLTDDYKCDNHYNMNIAMDCVVNQLLKDLPENCVTLESLSKRLNKQLEPNRGAWYYYKEIQQYIDEHPEEFPDNSAGMGDFSELDDHNQWPSEVSDAEKKIYENQLKSQIKATAEQVKKQAGTIPGELTDILERLKNKPPVFNWRKYFRRLIGNSITSEVQLTRMRPSKRIPDAKGIRMKRKPTILVGIDTSGSIGSNDLQDFFSEIHHVYKTGVNITVIEFDTKIQKIFEYKDKPNIDICGRGGTDCTELINYYKEHHRNYSTCIVFTDGYLSTFNLPKCQSLVWVIAKNGYKTEYPGKVIYIP